MWLLRIRDRNIRTTHFKLFGYESSWYNSPFQLTLVKEVRASARCELSLMDDLIRLY